MKLYILLILSMFQMNIYALSEHTEIWFLSAPKDGAITTSFNQVIWGNSLASNENRVCMPMGELCFDPQVGVYDPNESDAAKRAGTQESHEAQTKYLSDINTDLVNCDKDFYFDMFCGKSSKVPSAKSDLGIWVDISSSFRAIDPADSEGLCKRSSMVKGFKQTCAKSNPAISIFDTSIKAMGGIRGLCTTYGLNDTKRLIKWIKNANYKKLIVITDISEYTAELSDFVEANGIHMKGHKVGHELFANNLLENISCP